MSIFLRGVDMPECCGGCPCCYEKADGSCFCTAIKDGEPCDIDDLDQRLPNCPAEDVPEPHGYLIDRNAVINRALNLGTSHDPIVSAVIEATIQVLLLAIKDIPAVINAEGKEARHE